MGRMDDVGGRVTTQSRGLGYGTEVLVQLPLTEARGEPETVPPREAGVGARRVLIVDDNNDKRTTLRMLLQVGGHQVDEAVDGVEALEVLLRLRPDVAFIDLGLPGRDGFELAQAVRDAPGGTSLYLVALTGFGQPPDRRRALEVGFKRLPSQASFPGRSDARVGRDRVERIPALDAVHHSARRAGAPLGRHVTAECRGRIAAARGQRRLLCERCTSPPTLPKVPPGCWTGDQSLGTTLLSPQPVASTRGHLFVTSNSWLASLRNSPRLAACRSRNTDSARLADRSWSERRRQTAVGTPGSCTVAKMGSFMVGLLRYQRRQWHAEDLGARRLTAACESPRGRSKEHRLPLDDDPPKVGCVSLTGQPTGGPS
jgi:CheY-like chemotaxis protein